MGKISKEEISVHKRHHVIKDVRFESHKLLINIDRKEYIFNLKTISKKLFQASDTARLKFEISPSGYGIHWPVIDEDLSIDGLLKQKISTSHKKKKLIN